MRSTTIDDATHGDSSLSCWDFGGGEVRIQSRDPSLTHALCKSIRGLKLVGYSTSGEYLRLFQGNKKLDSVKRAIDRLLHKHGGERWAA